MIRVVLADDHTIVRDGLKHLLGAAGDIEVDGEASNGTEALERVLTLVFLPRQSDTADEVASERVGLEHETAVS